MADQSPFDGVTQGDVAFLEIAGVAYRCFVWQAQTTRSIMANTRFVGATVEAAIYIEQAHGESVEFWRGTVRTPAANNQVDCPRVVSFGQSFHVHWIEADPEETTGSSETLTPVGMELHRSTFDVEDDPSAWVYRGVIATGRYHLYDTQSLGPDDDYVLAHASDVDTVAVYRVNGADWIDSEWNISLGGLTMDENVLAVSANRGAPMVVYQSGSALRAFSRVWASGAAQQGETIITSSSYNGEVTAVGMCQRDGVTDGDVFLVAEYQEPHDLIFGGALNLPATVHMELDAIALAIPAREVMTPNTTLQSKPWRYVSAQDVSSDVPQFFAALGFQNDQNDQEWEQSHQYFARYEADASSLRGGPMVVATLSAGIADARPHGGVPPQVGFVANILTPSASNPRKRRNHLPSASPAPSFGPLVHSYTTFLGRWSRIDTVQVASSSSVGITVAGAALECTRFHHDDAWAFPYDDSNPALPTTPYASVGPPQLESVHAGAGLFLSGGTPQTYDGSRFVEAGFPWRPEIVDAREDDVAVFAIGNYEYTAVYEWRDSRGTTHRSEPAPPVAITNGGGRAVNLSIRCANLSAKDNPALGASGSPVKVDIYRTASNGGIFYPLFRGNDGLTTDLTDVPQNARGSLTITHQDAAATSTIADSVPLAFTQLSGDWSPLPGETIPALGAIASWQNRVVGVSSEETKRLWISREILPEARGEQYTVPEFHDGLTFRIDEVRGSVVAMQEMDSALILFTRDAIYSLHGTPADATGQGSTLQIQLLQRDTGCVEPRSIAPAPDGIYFQSRRGLYKLTRQNSLEFVGADVEDEIRAAGNIRAITVHEDSHQVRVLCNGGPTDNPQVLVYDWLFKLWAVWPLPTASTEAGRSSTVDALVWRGHVGEHAHVVLQAGGVLVQKASTSTTRYADESSTADIVAIPVDVRTGWIHLAGLAGFKRVRRIGLHFAKAADSGLAIRIEYDTDGTQTDGANIQFVVVASPAPAYYEVHCETQKCTSIRIRIFEFTDAPTGAALTESTLNLTAITLVVARKPGLARVSPTTQRS